MDMRNACTRPATAFLMVPMALLRDPTLSPLAKACLLFMASHAPGYVVRRSQIMARVGISIRTWNRAARELRQRGALRTVPVGTGTQAGLRGTYLQADWSQWHDAPPEMPSRADALDGANPMMVRFHDGRERDPDSDPKGIPNRIPKGSPKKRERKKERAGAREEGIAAAGRREAIQAPGHSEAQPPERELPSIERRRQIARELGLDPDRVDLWRLSGEACLEHGAE